MSDTSHAFCIYNPIISLGRGSKTNIMGLLDKIKDNFTKAEFTVSPQKKLKTLSAEFETAFGVELVFYKGKQIADGALTLPSKVKQAVIGLPYTMSIELPNVEIRTGDGTMQGRYKQVSGGTIRLSNSLGGEAGLTFDSMDQIQYDEFLATEDIQLFNGDKKYTPPPCDFNFEGRVCLRSSDPYPFNVLMITRMVI